MLRFTKTVIVAALAYAAALVPAYAEKRVALVVGNSAYKHAASLKNPQNDATGMAAALRRLGFRVFEGTDLDRRAMETRIRDFANDISDADVALFYYAGHGLQVNGTNYLAPVDATLKAEADLDFEAIPLKLVLRQMQRSARVNLVFLDACRDNPLAKKLGRASRSLTVGRGLAAVEKAAGMLIAFATQPGNVALDGDGRHSPFTQALLKRIESSDASINDVMIDVRRDVMAATKDQQVPWENSSLTGRFYFKTRSLSAASGAETAPVTKTIAVADTAMEHTFWTDIQNSNDPKLYRAFLKRFPDGVYAPIAKAKLQKSVRSIAVEARPQPKTEGKGTKVAQLQPADTAIATDATPTTTLDPKTLAMLMQSQLKRVGCYTGAIDGIWGRGSRAAVAKFNAHASAALEAEPLESSIAVVTQHKTRVCPVTVVRTKPKPRQRARTVAREPRPTTRRRPAPRPRTRVVHEEPVVRSRPSFSLGFSRRGGGNSISFGIGGFRF